MSKEKAKNEFFDKIEVEKDLLKTAPQNNQKNRMKYQEKIDELIEEYKKYESEILGLLENRYKKLTEIKKSEKIDNLEKRLSTIEENIYILSKYKTSYEKMELDSSIYKIKKYYKDKLENINSQIAECIKEFENVGIKLELDDFDYSIYVRQYMEIFLKELEKGNIDSDKLEAKFEELYWKCPEIIIYIELNIRNIYLKKQPQIDKYFEKEKNNLLKKWEKKPNEIIDVYFEIKKQELEEISQDRKTLIDEFINGNLNIKDFTPEKIKSNYAKILPSEMIEKIDEEQEEIEKNILKFLNSLYEYKNYMNFKYIIDDVKAEYVEKEKYKKAYFETKKKIDNAEKKLKNINKKSTKKGFFIFRFMKKETKQIAAQHQIIMDLKELYKELDYNEFRYQIYLNLTDNSTILDVLEFASSYYNYLIDCMIKHNSSITQEEMDEQIESLKEFLKNPYNTIINNLTILEEKDVALIIKDRYKLLNFLVEKEDMNLDNVDNFISVLEIIQKSLCLKKAGIKVEEIENILALKKILKK